jgi:hypothetical protein
MPQLLPDVTSITEIPKAEKGIKEFIDYLLSSQLQQSLFPIKVLFIVITFIFILAIFYFMLKTEYAKWLFLEDFKNFLSPKARRGRRYNKKWNKIQKNLEKGEFESQWKISLIEAFNLFEKVLTKMGYPGENLIEKLSKLSKEEVSNLEDFSKAAKICQDVISDFDYKLSKDKAKEIIKEFEKALTDLQIL